MSVSFQNTRQLALAGRFPTLRAADNGLSSDLTGTAHTVNLPSNIEAGDLLVAQFSFRNSAGITVTWPAGWVGIAVAGETGAAGQRLGAVAVRIANGAESSTMIVTTSGSQASQTIVSRISDHGHGYGDWPEIVVTTTATVTNDPPVLNLLGESANYLSIVMLCSSRNDLLTPPSGYSHDATTQQRLGQFSTGQTAQASRQYFGRSEDPGVWSDFVNTQNGINFTMAVRPALSESAKALGSVLFDEAPAVGAQQVTLPTIPSGSSANVPTLNLQVSATIGLPAIAAASLAIAVTLSQQSNENLAIPLVQAESGPSVLTLTDAGADTLALALVSSVNVVDAPTLVDTAIDSITLTTVTSVNVVAAPSLSDVGAESLTLPSIASGSATFVPTLSDALLSVITVGDVGPDSSVTVPVLSVQGDENLTLPIAVASSQANVPVLSQQSDTLSLPLISSGSAANVLTLIQQSNQPIVLPTVLSTAQAFVPTLSITILEVSLPTVPSGSVAFPPSLSTPGVVIVSLPAVPAKSRANVPFFNDSAFANGLPGVEFNPFEPSIPADLVDSLPEAGSSYLQNMAENLHAVYEEIQTGQVAMAADLLRHLAKTPRFALRSEGRFLHKDFGFISAVYMRYREDTQPGAPVGISRFDDGAVASVLADTVKDSALGFNMAQKVSVRGDYGWVVTRGKNLIPVLAGAAISTGDELGWFSDGVLKPNQPGPVVSRYVGGPDLVNGSLIPAGALDIGVQSSNASALISRLDGIDSSIQQQAIVDDGLAALITSLTVTVDSNVAAIQGEKTVRADSQSALARSVETLGVALAASILAETTSVRQASADGDSASAQLVESARAEFAAAIQPLTVSVASALDQLTIVADRTGAFGESISILNAQFEATDLAVAANALVIATNTASIVATDGTVSALSSTVGTNSTNIGNLSGTVTVNSASIVTLDNQVATVNAQWGVTVDVNNRIVGSIRLNGTLAQSTFDIVADKFRVYNNTSDIPIFEVSSGQILIKGLALGSTVNRDQGNGVIRTVGIGIATGAVRDGDVINFSNTWTSVPSIIFGAGGKAWNPAFNNTQGQSFKANNLSVSGFTASLRLLEGAGTTVNVTDSGSISAGFPDRRILKSSALFAIGNSYVFNYQVTPVSSPEPEQLDIEFYTRTTSGGAWTLRETITHFNAGTFNNTVSVTNLGSTAEFGMELISSGTFNAFNTVKYTTTTTPQSISATAANLEAIPFLVIGNKESV